VAYYIKARRWSTAFGLPTAMFLWTAARRRAHAHRCLVGAPALAPVGQAGRSHIAQLISLALSTSQRSQLARVQQSYLARPDHPYAQLLGTTALSATSSPRSQAG